MATQHTMSEDSPSEGDGSFGDEHDASEVSIQEEEKIKYWKFPVPQERAMYEQLCRGEETLTDL